MKKVLATVLAVSIISGCASGLNSVQEKEYSAWERDGVLIKEKNPDSGFAFGFLPGGGSFYARSYGLGVLNLLTWPLSILWDPVSGSDGSKVINYDITQHDLKLKKQKEIAALDDQLTLSKISKEQYVVEKRKLESKYEYQ